VALGYWLSEAQLAGELGRVSYVKINDRAANMACMSVSGLYRVPRNDSVVVHFLKKPGGMDYVWGLLHSGIAHHPDNCTAWAWHDGCPERSGWCRRHWVPAFGGGGGGGHVP